MKLDLTLIERWNAPTSRFFKPLQTLGVWLAALGAAFAVLTQILDTSSVPVPAIVELLSGVFGLLGALMATLSKLTVDFGQIDWTSIQRARELKLKQQMGYYR